MMNTRLTKEDRAIIKEARGNKCSGPIYSEDGLRLLIVLGNPEYLEVKDGVKAICDDACQGLDNLHEVVLPASVTDLGTRAFASCIKLFKITMPGIEFIGTESFAPQSSHSCLDIQTPDACNLQRLCHKYSIRSHHLSRC